MSNQYFNCGMYDDVPFHMVYHWLRATLMDAPKVDVGEWHAMDVKGRPELVSRELRAVTFHTTMSDDAAGAVLDHEPNLPWAEEQFQERVSGIPHNPGETYKNWPWQSNMSDHRDQEKGKFSHTYMERYWPRMAGEGPPSDHFGIRYRYGDLNDVVSLLARSPFTRQAVLPVWFPEDTGGHHGGRLPCSLTYHFLLRDNRLHCEYSIRSCDFVRHFRDDVYMTVRLVQWVIEKLQHGDGQEQGTNWEAVVPGTLTMHIGSLHIFEGDIPRLQREIEEEDDDLYDRLHQAFS